MVCSSKAVVLMLIGHAKSGEAIATGHAKSGEVIALQSVQSRVQCASAGLPVKMQKKKTHLASFPGPEYLAGESGVLIHASPFMLLGQPLVMHAAI